MIDMFVLLTLFTLQALWGLRLKQEGGELSGSRVEVWPSGSERQLRELLNIMATGFRTDGKKGGSQQAHSLRKPSRAEGICGLDEVEDEQ